MAAGQPSIMTLIGGSSSLNAGAPTVYYPNLTVSPINITVASVVALSTLTTNYSVWFSNDNNPSPVTASSSSGTVFFNASTTFASSITWFSSLGTNSTNSFYNITWPVRAITVVASAGSTDQIIRTTIVQAG